MEQTETTRLARLAAWTPTVAVVLTCAALIGWTQFSFDGLRDSDSYFHARAARELDREGVQKTFPQTVYSTWRDRYSDKDLLFHRYLIPFQRWHVGSPHAADAPTAGTEDLVLPAKWASVTLTLVFFAVFALALVAIGARYPWVWLLLFFVADAPMLYRFLLVRPGLLGVTLLVAEVTLILKRRRAALFAVGALHTLSHSSFLLLPVMALAAGVAALLRREPFPWKTLGAAMAGPAAASLLHPYFPNNLSVVWDQSVEVARGVWLGSEIPAALFGSELVAARTDQFLGSFPIFLPAVAGVLGFLATARRLSTACLALLLMSGVLLAAGFGSERFLAFFFPVVTLLGARLWTELLGPGSLRAWLADRRRLCLTGMGVLLVALAAGGADGGVLAVRARVQGMETAATLRPAVDFLRLQADEGDLVYHNFWWDFSILYHFRPQGRYMVALDPVFYYRKDVERFRDSLAAYQGQQVDLYRLLKDEFGARWIFLPKATHYHPFFELVRRDNRFRKAYEDDYAIIARVP